MPMLRITSLLAVLSLLACHDLDHGFGPEGATAPEFQVSATVLGWHASTSRGVLYAWTPGRVSRLTVTRLDGEEEVVVWEVLASTPEGIGASVWHGVPPANAVVTVPGDPRLLAPEAARYRVSVIQTRSGVGATAEFEL
jgi:hypothetical protein